MATNNFNVQDLSGVVFKPISSKIKRSCKSAKVAPEEYIAPKAIHKFQCMNDGLKIIKSQWCQLLLVLILLRMRILYKFQCMKDGTGNGLIG